MDDKWQLHACTARVELEVTGALTLKDRRAVVRSLIERLKSKFNLSVADLDGGDGGANRAVLGIAAVSNGPKHADETVQKAVEFIEADGRVDVGEVEIGEM